MVLSFADGNAVRRATCRASISQGTREGRGYRGSVYNDLGTAWRRCCSLNIPLPYVSQRSGRWKPMITLKFYTRWIPSGQVHRVNVLDSVNNVLTPATTIREAAASVPV